ncbi:unnamed protein product [Brachionus calyciflorus]|uniref:ATPase AAA-type core domain-containing protein n=1 Tax=Brachionus calyciflorus TaxID=104777 RepID=A0A814FRQ0_9BILA|nr:unnamed protein product [Brachionus calyciflorus]
MSSETLKFAKSLVVCLIKSPLYSTSAENSPNLDQELTEFFQTTRTFQLNDYFHIRNKSNSSIYYTFKIIKVEPNDLSKFNVNTIQTSLSQSNSIEDKWIWLEKNDTERLILKEYTTEIKKILEFNEFMNQEETPLLLIHGPNGGAKTRSVQMACQELNFHLCKVNCVNLAGESASAIEKRIDIFIQNSLNYGPCVLLFKSFQYLFKLKDINEFNKRVLNYFFQAICSIKAKTEHKVMVVCSTNSKQNLNSDILSRFNHDIEVKVRKFFFFVKIEKKNCEK